MAFNSNFSDSNLGLSSFSDVIGGNGNPWDNDDTTQDSFFDKTEIIGERWNGVFPYQLLVVDASNDYRILATGNNLLNPPTYQTFENGVGYLIQQAQPGSSWIYNFPLTPQQLSLVDSYSNNVTATARGVVEEHSGSRFVNIVISGSTGVWPTKPTLGAMVTGGTSALESIFGGTIEAAAGVANAATTLFATLQGKGTPQAVEAQYPKNLTQTGYYQAMLLGQFLERYVTAKKNPKNKNWRLVFNIPKQNKSYIVTPQQFTINQNVNKPVEYLYTLQLKSWKRINLGGKAGEPETLPFTLKPNLFQSIVAGIAQVRSTLASVKNLIQAVRSDFASVFDQIRQVGLAVKDVAEVAYSVADLPNEIIHDAKSAIKDFVSSVQDAGAIFGSIGDIYGSNNSVFGSGTTSNQLVGTAVSLTGAINSMLRARDPKVPSIIANAIKNQSKVNEGLTANLVKAGNIGDSAARQLNNDELDPIFSNPYEYFDFHDKVKVNQLVLTDAQQTAINNEIAYVRTFTTDTFNEIKKNMKSVATDLANNFGAGDSTVSQIYGLQTPTARSIPMTLEENEILLQFYEFIFLLDQLTATKGWNDRKLTNNLQYVGQLANDSGIDFTVSPTKYAVPVPFGSTIEAISARYLQDPNRWIEIATLNNLRSPYIDEDGFFLPLLSNAQGRTFTVNDADNRLFIGQVVLLQSIFVGQFSRHIVDIKPIDEQNNYLVSVDGEDNLDNLLLVDNARAKVYLPGTVNSQNYIYIPSNQPAQVDDRTFDVVGVNPTQLNKMSKIDLLLTEGGDLAVDSFGDIKLAVGLNNLIQALKIKIKTRKGSIHQHLEFGSNIASGVSVADIESGSLLRDLDMMIKSDPRFSSISRLELRLVAPTLYISLSVTLPNGNGVIPVTFDVKM